MDAEEQIRLLAPAPPHPKLRRIEANQSGKSIPRHQRQHEPARNDTDTGADTNLGSEKVLTLHRCLHVSTRHGRHGQACGSFEGGLQPKLFQDPSPPLQGQGIVQHLCGKVGAARRRAGRNTQGSRNRATAEAAAAAAVKGEKYARKLLCASTSNL